MDPEGALSERELAGDAPWKLIQKNCFTRWTNEHLKTVNKNIANLESDLADGLRLIALVEVLSGKRFMKFNKRPKFRNQKLENVTIALKFLETDEGIRIVNIDSSDIVDAKLKLILGLIWTLILHYSISMPTWEDEEGRPPKPEQTPKQRMLNWIQGKISDRPVTNFTTDWNDGRAIGALVDGIAPGLCPDWENWVPEKALPNCTEAMNAAEEWLDVPQLIKPAEMCNPKVDELSMMTYLSQFPNAKLKPGAPLRPKTNASRVRAYGPGLESKGNTVGAQARFTVETFGAGRGDLQIIVINPNGVEEQHESVFNKDQHQTYSCSYTPTSEGQYTVTVKFAERDIPKSPFTVGVQGFAGDPSKVTASGPGLEKTGVLVKKRTYFEVFTKNAGMGAVDVAILDPQGHRDSTRPTITQKAEGVWLVEYYPTFDGLHSINVFFAGKAIPNSPFGVGITPAIDAKKCFVTGRGVQLNGIRVGDKPEFTVHTDGAGDGELVVKCEGPAKKATVGVQVKKINPTTYVCCYEPTTSGEYIFPITFGGQQISKSPFVVEVGPNRPTDVRAYGRGLEAGVVGFPATFTVESTTGHLGFSIEGPSQTKIECHDNGDNSANISYIPFAPGEYAVHILCDEEDIQGSPWMVNVVAKTGDFDPTKVTAHGPGIEKNGLVLGSPLEFTVDTRKAGSAPLGVTVIDADQLPIEVTVKDNKDGTFLCKYVPKRAVKHVVCVMYGGVVIPNFPVQVTQGVSAVADPTKVKVFGPALDKPVKVHEPTHIVVDCSKAGPGDVAVCVLGPRGVEVPMTTSSNHNNSFNINFTPEHIGTHEVLVQFAGQDVPGTPFKITAVSANNARYDASKVKVYGNGVESTGVLASLPVTFMVDTTHAGDADIEIIIEDPAGHCVRPEMIDNGNGIYSVTYTPEGIGCYIIPVKFGGDQVPSSPFKVGVAETGDASKVKFPDAVHTTIPVGEECVINLDTSDAGQGRITCRIGSNAESDVDIDIIDNGDGTVSIVYTPRKPGSYTTEIKFGGKTIPNGTFTQKVLNADEYQEFLSAGVVEELVEPIRMEDVKSGRPASGTFPEGVLDQVDFRLPVGSDFSLVAAEITTPSGVKVHPRIADNHKGAVSVFFSPTETGLHHLSVTYDGVPIAGSPFQFFVGESKPGQVTAHGPGLSHGVVGNRCDFTINTKDAGDGGLSLAIEGPSKAEMDCSDNGDDTCSVSYLPTEPGKYTINIKFGNDHIQGSPFTVKVVPADGQIKAAGFGLVGTLTEVSLSSLMVDEADIAAMSAIIRTPSGKEEPCVLKRLSNGQLGVSFTPREAGDHLVTVLKHGKAIPNSPFTIRVDTKAAGFGLVGTLTEVSLSSLMVDEADIAAMSATIRTPSGKEEPCVLKRLDNGQLGVSFTPREAGDHLVTVLKHGKAIPNSPFTIRVDTKAAGVGLVGTLTEVSLSSLMVDEADIAAMSATIRTPSGKEEPCVLKRLDNGQLGVSFTPREAGDHLVTVLKHGKAIPNSPFTIRVDDSEIGDASRVRAYGKGLTAGTSNEFNEFTVDSKTAGFGGLSLSVEGPSKADIECGENPDGTCQVKYKPTEPGDYVVNVKFANEHITGSPFLVKITGEGAGHSSERKQRAQNAADITHIGSECELSLKIPNTKVSDLQASITSPSGKTGKCEVSEIGHGQYSIGFVPTEIGVHTVSVKHHGIHIPGSPFQFTVGPIVDIGAHKVRSIGPGLEKGEVNVPGHFSIYTHEAGAGSLSVSMEGPAQPEVTLQDQKDGSCEVQYICSEPGEYLVTISFNDQQIPDSPFKISVGTSKADSTTLNISDLRDQICEVNKPASFAINLGKIRGRLDARVVSPSGVESEATVRELADGQFAVGFVFRENGIHQIHLRQNGAPVHGSPFRVMVGQVDSDAAQVKTYGDGLSQGETGRQSKFTVDTSKAGSGALAVTVDGPSKVQLQCNETSEGYQFTYVPAAPGDYLIFVKYAGTHVAGSPFKAHVTGKGLAQATHELSQVVVETVTKSSTTRTFSAAERFHDADAAKIKSRGVGLLTAQLSQESTFAVDASCAGSGMLLAGVVGPRIPCEEMSVRHLGSGHYTVKYRPSERGEHLLFVKWADEHIPGSPFHIMVQ